MSYTALIDPSDTFDTDREWPVPNFDYTDSIPPIPGTTAEHPMDCRCLPCQADAEWMAWEAEADFLAEQAGERAFAEALERRAENGKWWGR